MGYKTRRCGFATTHQAFVRMFRSILLGLPFRLKWFSDFNGRSTSLPRWCLKKCHQWTETHLGHWTHCYPFDDDGNRSEMLYNEYSLAQALSDGKYVKNPAIATRKTFRKDLYQTIRSRNYQTRRCYQYSSRYKTELRFIPKTTK